MARKPDHTTSSSFTQLIDYRLQLMQLLSYCQPAETDKIMSEIALVDSFIGEIRGSKRMIVVVDDESVVADTLVEVLRLSGYEAFSTAHVLEAVALCADLRPELALIDVMLGEANGVELALELDVVEKPRREYSHRTTNNNSTNNTGWSPLRITAL